MGVEVQAGIEEALVRRRRTVASLPPSECSKRAPCLPTASFAREPSPVSTMLYDFGDPFCARQRTENATIGEEEGGSCRTKGSRAIVQKCHKYS
jgi:hypothetical protein